MFGAYDRNGDYSYSLGAFPTIELIKNRPEDVVSVALSSRLRMTDELAAVLDRVAPLVVTDDRSVDRVSKKGNVFVAGKFRKRYVPFSGVSHVALVRPSDAGNLGTIMRTMLGFGIRNLAIVGPDPVDEYDPRTVRASMGAVFSLNIEKHPDFSSYEKAHGERRFMFMLGASASLSDVCPCEGPFALVFGNEATGLPGELADRGTPVVIRHSRDIDSLNLPQAAGIALYEFTKADFGGNG